MKAFRAAIAAMIVAIALLALVTRPDAALAVGQSMIQVHGLAASGSAMVGYPVVVGGASGSLVYPLNLDTNQLLKVNIASNSITGANAQQVQGTAASGSAAVGNPVQIGGQQTNGNMQTVKVGPDGYLWAVLGASTSAIGSVTQGASNSLSWPVMLANGTGTQQGTSANPLRTDPTGTTAQPVTQGASGSLPWLVQITAGDGTRTTWDARTPAVAQVAVTNVATQLSSSPPAKQVQMCMEPMDAEVRFGPSGVTWATGWPLTASQSMCIDLFNGASWYGIVSAGTSQVRVLTTASAN